MELQSQTRAQRDRSRQPQSANLTWGKSVLRSIGFVSFCLLAVVVLFLLFEGLSSSWRSVHGFVSSVNNRDVDMAYSTQYDPELGWVNIPNFYSRNFYNPGVYVQTDSKGFRNREEIEVQVPVGKLRVVCSGDSFTFGIGVDNDHTWCEQLSSLDQRLQAVNMGVPGYGVDQIYLMYRRDGTRLDYDAQIFALITDDFRRMQKNSFLGYGKPELEVRDGQLEVTDVPVKKASGLSRAVSGSGSLFANLSSVAVLQSLLDKFRPARHSSSHPIPDNTREVTAKILESLQALNHKKNATLVVVLLPTLGELTAAGPSQSWRGFLRDESAKQGITFIDLLEDAQTLPISELDKLFIPHGSQRFMGTAGHLSDYGNQYVSRKIYQALQANPVISVRLSTPH